MYGLDFTLFCTITSKRWKTGSLWTTYINDTMEKYVLKYSLNKVEDAKVKPVIELALGMAEKHIQELSTLFTSEGVPIP